MDYEFCGTHFSSKGSMLHHIAYWWLTAGCTLSHEDAMQTLSDLPDDIDCAASVIDGFDLHVDHDDDALLGDEPAVGSHMGRHGYTIEDIANACREVREHFLSIGQEG